MGAAPAKAAGAIDAVEAENAALRQKAAELEAETERLRLSEKMYRFSAEISGRLVWSTDADGRVVSMSPAFTRLSGLDDEQALKEGWIQFVHPDDRDRVRDRWAEAVASGEAFAEEFRVILADGTCRTILSRALPARDERGCISCWYGSSEDVEEERRSEQARREAEEKLRISEELHRYTLELSQQIAWTVEPDGSGLKLSERYHELTGMADDEGARLSIHPDDRDWIVSRFEDSLSSGRRYEAECRLRMKDGNYRMFRLRAAPWRDEDGRIVRWYGVSEDIHERQQAERARRDVEERYRLAIQATNDAVWDYDLVQGLIDWSDNAAAILGYSEPLGRTSVAWWEDRIHPEDKLEVVRDLGEAIEQGASRWSATYRFLREDGSYADMLDRGFIIRTASGAAIRAVGAMADLTERHRAEAKIRQMQAELTHVSRLSAMGTMASTLAHELNQPLTALSNFISGARRMAEKGGAKRQAELVAALVSAEAGAQRAGEIVRRLRELVSRGTVSVVVEHLPKLIEDAGVLAFVDERLLGVRHRIDLDPAAQWVKADRIQIQQVLINLVRNAVDAMEASSEREVAISTHAISDEMVEVRVADTGPGIAPELLDSLFSQFMTTKRGGMGIGLPISRTIVEAHGGKIWGHNREGGGAVFCFTLPRARGRSQKLPKL